jgi:hypothetical protein
MGWEHEAAARDPATVTLPRLKLAEIDAAAERKETAARIVERRIIRTARDTWASASKANSWEATTAIGAALLIGRNYALRVTGLDVPHGRHYSMALRSWMRTNGFATMSNQTRKHIVILTENAAAVTAWRNGLPERERNRIANPQHLYRRWQASLKNGHGKCLDYVRRDAVTALRRFITSVKLLPAHEAAPLWQAVMAEASAHV